VAARIRGEMARMLLLHDLATGLVARLRLKDGADWAP
jgi:hypothetical protein